MTRSSTETSNEVILERLAALELAVSLGSVSEACRRTGISRTQFYEYKRRFEAQGVDGLRDLPPIARQHPAATPPAVISRLMEVSMLNPSWGCVRLSEFLANEGVRISGPTVQKILNQRGLGTVGERLSKLEELAMGGDLDLNEEQLRTLERMNPAFRERHRDADRPGLVLCQDTVSLGHFYGIGQVYAQLVVDTFNSYAFGYLHLDRLPEHAAGVLHYEVMPQYVKWGVKVQSILTDLGREYSGSPTHSYQLYLSLNDIQHHTTESGKSLANGFIERLHRVVLDEYVRSRRQIHTPWTLDSLQNDFRGWLERYNYERPLLGFPTMGKAPGQTLTPFLPSVTPTEPSST